MNSQAALQHEKTDRISGFALFLGLHLLIGP
jgi:hypothetical protein